MELYKNIRNRRIELGLTQEDLAKKIGYRSISTIAKIERGINDIPQSKIKAFADALNTTPSQLMGDVDSPPNSQPTKKVPKDLKKILEDEEVTLNGRMMSAEDKEKMMRIIEAAFYEAKEMNKRK